MDSDRAHRVGHRIAEIVHLDPDRDPGTPFADRLEVRQALTRLAPSRMSKPSKLGGAPFGHRILCGWRPAGYAAGSRLQPAEAGERLTDGGDFAQELKAHRNFESSSTRAATLQI